MLTLVLDTVSNRCAVGLFKNEEMVASQSLAMQRGQAENIVPFCQKLLKPQNMGQLSKIIVHQGPGSYTGIRVGLAAAHGLSIALNIPIIAVNGCEAYFNQLDINFDQGETVLCLLDSGRDDFYLSLNNQEIQMVAHNNLKDFLIKNHITTQQEIYLIGNKAVEGAQILKDLFSPIHIDEAELDLSAILRAGLAKKHIESAKPLYILNPHTT